MVLGVLFTAASCSGLRAVDEVAPLLVENNIQVNGRITKSDDDFDIMRQRPNRGIGNIRIFLSLHQIGTSIGENVFGQWLKSIGEAPAVYDSVARVNSAAQLGLHYFNLGFYKTEVTTYETVKRKKVIAHYRINTGPEYTISKYSITSTSRFIDSALAFHAPLLATGDAIVAETLENEQLSVLNFLKNHGYYQAKLGWVYFEVDTTGGPSQSQIACIVDPYIYGGNIERKTLSKITVEPNYSYTNTLAVRDSVRTLNGMDILQHSRSFRPGFLDDQIFLARGGYYNNSELRSTFKNLTALGVFKNIELDIKDLDSTLTARIKLVPLPKRAVTAAIEGLGNNGSLGIGGNFSWDNRNLFKGGELLRLSIGGSVTEQRNSTNNTWLIDARELNSSATLRIPKLLLPGAWIPGKSKKWSPRTEIISKVSYQFRANEFNRLNLTNRLDYHWKIGKTKHTLTPAQLSLIRIDLNAVSQSTPFLFVGFQDLVFASTAYRFSETWSKANRRYFLAADLESGGHLWHALDTDRLVSLPISRFVKTSIDFRFYQPLVRKRELAFRSFLGMSQSWGEASIFTPFEKSYFMGGSNDMRGWTAYHFGPGATPENLLQSDGFFTAAPIKLILSGEYRYTIQEALKAAIFIDAGNMWLYAKDYGGVFNAAQQEAIALGQFYWDTFFKQLGLNTGIGLRYDIEFFILRADLGLKIHHPGAVDRSNWVISDPKLRDLNINIGIGYPF